MNPRLHYPDLKFKHSVDIQARFSDFDTFGHVNNNSYMAYLDLGKTAFFRVVMGGDCTPARLSAVIVNVNVDFLSPALQGEPLAVATAVVHLGEKSFALYQRVYNRENGDVKVQARSTLAGFDIRTQTSAPLREDVVQTLEKYLVIV